MKRQAATLTALLVAGPCIADPPSDWRVYGGETIAGVHIMEFYASGDIRKMPSGFLQVWVKGNRTDDIEQAVQRGITDTQMQKRVSDKVNAKYVPVFATSQGLTGTAIKGVIITEDVANFGGLETVWRVLYEFDCTEATLRILSYWSSIKGDAGSAEVTSPWQHIAPETRGAFLKSVVCPAG